MKTSESRTNTAGFFMGAELPVGVRTPGTRHPQPCEVICFLEAQTPLQRCSHDGERKRRAQTRVLRVVEVATAGGLRFVPLPLRVLVVETEECIAPYEPKIHGAATSDDGTDLELSRQPLEDIAFLLDCRPHAPELRSGHEKLGGCAITELSTRWFRKESFEPGDSLSFAAQPDVRQLVGQREHLCRLGIHTVHEDQRRVGVCQSKATELLNVEFAGCVVADDA